ncbi:Oidioi.mRNA.OKI2018_I69.chr2.g7327.t1.cds [Oikopleura dioica]|uniref:Oidioi.mRNA.OKI2018_I69.chr2.g7327.t1.cds n=1 Tax=Oikopleura dioica TaxID=34765 RepID=A0ABN7T6T7_OIKDI|nr:Oidioi.mRNA.OKI2018_I69.chr2.g7327.t1.cds [Oikopleura dioica]
MREMRGHHRAFYDFLERQNATRRQCWEQWLLTRDYEQPMPAFPPALTRDEMFIAYQQHYMSRMPFRPRGNTLPSSLNLPTTFRTRNAASFSETRENQSYINTPRNSASPSSGVSGSKSFLPSISEEQKENRYVVLTEPDFAREATLAAFLPDKKEDALYNHDENEEIITLTEVIEDNHTESQQHFAGNLLDQVNNTNVDNNYQTPERETMKEHENELMKAVQGPKTRRSSTRLQSLQQMRNRLSVESINSIQMQQATNMAEETLPLNRDIFGGCSNRSLMPRRKRRTTSIAVNHDNPIIIEDDNEQNGTSDAFEIVDQLKDAKQDVSTQEKTEPKEDSQSTTPTTTKKATEPVSRTPMPSSSTNTQKIVEASNPPTRTSVEVSTMTSGPRSYSSIGMAPLSPVGSLPMPEFQVTRAVTTVARTPSRTRVTSLSSYRSHASLQSSNPPSLPISSLNTYMSPLPAMANQAPFIPSRAFPGIIDSEPALPDEIFDILEDLRVNPPSFDHIYTDDLDVSTLEKLEAALDKDDLLFSKKSEPRAEASAAPSKEMPTVLLQQTMKRSVDPAKISCPPDVTNVGKGPVINLTSDKPLLFPVGLRMPKESEVRLPRQSAAEPLKVIEVTPVRVKTSPQNETSPIEKLKNLVQGFVPGVDIEPLDQSLTVAKAQISTKITSKINKVVQVKENGDHVVLEEIMPSNVRTLTVEAPAVTEVSGTTDHEGKVKEEEGQEAKVKKEEIKPMEEKAKVKNEVEDNQETDIKEGVRFYSPPAFRTRAQSFSRRSLQVEDKRSFRRFKREVKKNKEKESTLQILKKETENESSEKIEKSTKNDGSVGCLQESSSQEIDNSISKEKEFVKDQDVSTDKDGKKSYSKKAAVTLFQPKEKKTVKKEAKSSENGRPTQADRTKEISVAITPSERQPKISDFLKKTKRESPTIDEESHQNRDGQGRFLSFAAMGFKPIEKNLPSKKDAVIASLPEKPQKKLTTVSEKKVSSTLKLEAPKEEKVEESMPRRSDRIKDINAPQKKKTKVIKIENVDEEVEKLKRKMKKRTPEKLEKIKTRNTKEQAETIRLIKSPRQKRKKLEDIEVKSLSPASSEDEKEIPEESPKAKVPVAPEPRKLRRTKDRVKYRQAQKARERKEAEKAKRKKQVEDKQWNIQCSVCRQKYTTISGFKNHQHWSPECR